MEASVGESVNLLAFFALKGVMSQSDDGFGDFEDSSIAMEAFLPRSESLAKSLCVAPISVDARVCTLSIMKVVTPPVTCELPTTTIAYVGSCPLREDNV